MKVAFIVPCRDKERHVAACARSVLAQTFPCDIFFSDQGSTDGTRAVLADLVAGYSGHHRVHLVDCPHTEHKQMVGLNAHLNWLDTQIEGDIVVMCSADDLNHPDRAKFTVEAFEKHNPSYVNTGVRYVGENSELGFTSFPNQSSRMLGIEETIRHQIGSCGSSAWARDLYRKHAPLVGFEQQDMILPMMAIMERGIYYVDMPLHTYVMRPSLENTGFQGQIAAAKDERHRAALIEVNNFAHVRNWTRILERWQHQPGWLERLGELSGAYDALMEKITGTAYGWAYAREALILDGVPRL